jgi:hypothetical protein
MSIQQPVPKILFDFAVRLNGTLVVISNQRRATDLPDNEENRPMTETATMNARNTANRNAMFEAARTNASLTLSAVPYNHRRWIRGLIAVGLITFSSAIANAELVMRFNGQVVESQDEIDMGEIPLGESRQVVLTLRNESAEEIFFSENPPIIKTGGFEDEFSLIQPALEIGNKLSPNGSTAFAVRCEPTFAFANLFTHVYIWTTESATPLHLRFRAAGTAPALAVSVDGQASQSGDTFDMGEVEQGSESTVTVMLTNSGSAPLVVQSLEFTGDDQFEVTDLPSTTIAPNSSESVELTYFADGTTADSTIMTLVTNDTIDDVNGEFMLEFTASTFVPEPVTDPAQQDEADPNDSGDQNVGNDPNQVDDQGGPDETGDLDEAGDLNSDEFDTEDLDENTGDVDDNAGNQNDNTDNLENDDEYTDEEVEEVLEELQPIVPVGGCGFGLGLCSLLSMASMGAMKGRRRNNR